jgi:preprotein translocase SecE subunit
VARQTRDERRKRRAQADASADAGDRVPPRPPLRLPPEPAPAPGGPPRAPSGGAYAAGPSRNPLARAWHFIAETIAELKKVEWPRQQQVLQGTVVVLIACLVVGFYLYGADQVFKRLVQDVLLR